MDLLEVIRKDSKEVWPECKMAKLAKIRYNAVILTIFLNVLR
jgi:hypothetical protein